MKCPNCKESNPKGACFCHVCGWQLKQSEMDVMKEQLENKESEIEELNERLSLFRKRANAWLISCVIFFILTIVLGLFSFHYAQKVNDYIFRGNNLFLEKSRLESQIHDKEVEISELESQIHEKEVEISELETQLPQTYLTKYPDQQLYYRYWDGSYKETDCVYEDENSLVYVYSQESGYGLTDWGWVPMSRLKKK